MQRLLENLLQEFWPTQYKHSLCRMNSHSVEKSESLICCHEYRVSDGGDGG